MAKKLPLITDFTNIPDEALVPEDEQPYEIPAHWKWVRLSSIVEVNPQKDKLAHLSMDLEVSFIPMAAVSEKNGIVASTETRLLGSVIKGYTNFRKGDVLFARITPCMENGKAAIVPPLHNQIGYGSTEFFVLRPSPVVQSSLIHTWIRQRSYRLEAEYNMTGAVGQQRVPKSFVEASPFPLPPLREQHKIVDYLEKTNAKIDEVIQRLEQYVEGAPGRRAELIQAGVSGFLTSNWRREQGKSTDDWESITLGEAFRWSSGGTPSRKRPEYYKGTIPWIKSGELPDGRIPDSEEHISEDAVANSSAKLFPANSVLIAMYGATIGKVGILDSPATTNQAIACALPSSDTIPEFLALFLRAKKSDFIALGKGGAQPNISQTIIKAFPFRRPPLEEQRLIVEIILNGLAKIDASVSLIQQALNDIGALREATTLAALSGKISLTP